MGLVGTRWWLGKIQNHVVREGLPEKVSFVPDMRICDLVYSWQTCSEKGQIGNKSCGASGPWILHLCCCREKADMTVRHQMGWLCSNKMLFMEINLHFI